MGLGKRTNEDEKEFARQDLAQLTAKANQEKIDLVYFDGSGFNLRAKVLYAWQRKGKRIPILVIRGKAQNVLGFMWHRCRKFESYVFEETSDLSVVTGCFDKIARDIKKETVIVIDNAPVHRSKEFEEKLEGWAELGLHLYYLPTYCPSLNKIEILWKKIKYKWLSWEAYTSNKNLCEKLDKVLSQIGSKYYVTFA